MTPYVLAIDQGTTGTRAVVVGPDGRVVATNYREHRQFYPQPGWVEHDANEIWASVLATISGALASCGLAPKDIAAIGIANQRETAVLWDRATGEPTHRALVWQCRRTSEVTAQLRADGLEPTLTATTGLLADPYFSATKVQWLLRNVPGARAAAEAGGLAFGTIDSWIIWKLTGGRNHVTDVSNASRTMLLSIHTLQWDPDLLKLFDIPEGLLPAVVDSAGPTTGSAGTPLITDPTVFGAAVPISGIAGDQQAATFGQACFEAGQAKSTYGTGCFLLMNTGCRAAMSQHRLLTTVGWRIGGEVTYCLEGSVFVAGAAIGWLRDGLGLLSTSSESEELAQSVADCGGVYFVPALTGLGAPHWDPDARGAIVGLTRGTDKRHIVRAALEAMAYQSCDLLIAMQADCGSSLTSLRIDGGASANNFLAQFQADIAGVPVERPAEIETTALGAAYLAGLGIGLWHMSDVAGLRAVDRSFAPLMPSDTRASLLEGWQRAVSSVLTRP